MKGSGGNGPSMGNGMGPKPPKGQPFGDYRLQWGPVAEGIPDEAVTAARARYAEMWGEGDIDRAGEMMIDDVLVAAAPLIVARAVLAERVKIVNEIRQRAEKIRGESWTPSAGVALAAVVNDVADMVNTLPEDGPGPHTAGTTEQDRLAEIDARRRSLLRQGQPTATCPVCHRVTTISREDRFTHHTSDGMTYCPGSGEEVPVSESADG